MKRGYLLDMDGVLYRGSEPVPHAREFIQWLQAEGMPYLLLTNNGCLTPESFSRRLLGMGLEVPAERIYSSALATAKWLSGRGIERVFAIGEEGLMTALAEQGIGITTEGVKQVIVGLDRSVTYEKLALASRLIRSGAEFIVTNPDPTYPTENGDMPECGLLLGALENVTGKKAIVIGKPAPVIFRQAARHLGIPIKNLAMIGDRLDTDIAGALGVGARAILVLTGHTTRAMLRRSAIQPGQVVKHLGCIAD